MMNNRFVAALFSAIVGFGPIGVRAQLSSNPDKFLGNITTGWSNDLDYSGIKYYSLWNQVTPENASKWESVEGTRNSFNWSGVDKCVNYAKQHDFPFKFHALVWGSQFPGWLRNLSPGERYEAIVKWMDAVKKKYPNLQLIDVVNEAIDGHQNDTPLFKEALGGGGVTGYDWLIKAFELAYERWPDAILIYNDFNTFQWNTDQYITLVRTLRDAGAPVDAYGCQAHDLKGVSLSSLQTVDTKIQNALKMPMYISEYDIQEEDDQKQLKDYKNQIPYLWERDYCAGITLWGWIYGKTWKEGVSGIVKNGKDRAAMTWLREYMQSDAAKTAKSPFPGMVKEASVYVKPASLKVAKGDKLPVTVRARLKTKTIEKVDLYVGDELIATMTEAPYVTEFVSSTTGTKTLKAVVTATDGTTYERYSRVNVLSSTVERKPFNGVVAELPGVIEAENFDEGADGVAFHDSDSSNQGDKNYRSNGGGVDIVKVGDDNYGINNTKDGEWLEYTVDVKEAGLYSLDADVASLSGGRFHLLETGSMTFLSSYIDVPKTGGNSDFAQFHVRLSVPLEVGRQVIRLCVDKGGFTIDKLGFSRLEVNDGINISIKSNLTTTNIAEPTTITVTASSASSDIVAVKVYANDMLIQTLTEAPFDFSYQPTEKGTCTLTAIAFDAEGRESKIAKSTLKVNGVRLPYKDVISIPGIFQAENFDRGGEGLSFHDSNDQNEGDANYRSDGEGVDFVKGNGGTVIGYTAANEWLEYSVNVTEPGEYSCDATVSSGTTGSGFTLGLVENGKVTNLCKINVPQTGNNNWDTYKVVTAKLSRQLEVGEHVLRITINGANCNIDKLELKCTLNTGIGGVYEATAEKCGESYNLSGQKVGASYKGLVIMNGKKVVRR